MFKSIADGFNYLFQLIIDGFLWLLEGLGKLFAPIFDLIGAIFYLIYMLGVILVKVILVVVFFAKMLIGLSIGLFKTFSGFGYTGADAAIPASYANVFGHLQGAFGMLQLDNLAYLFIVAIWIFTGIGAIRIISK